MKPLSLSTLHFTTILAFCVYGDLALAQGQPVVATAAAATASANQTAPITLFEQMLLKVYQENPKLNAERKALGIEDEKVAQANGGFRPTASVDLATGRQRQKIGDGDWLNGSADSEALTVTQPLFSGFGVVEQKRGAEKRVLAAQARLLAAEQNTLFTAISDWMELCEKERVLALTADNRQRIAHYGDATRERFKAGDSTDTEVAQTESRLAIAETRYAQALAARDIARASFTRDTGLPAPAVNYPPLPERLPESYDEAIAAAKNNPALLQALHEEEAAEHDVGTAESALWPKVFLRGSMGEQHASFLGLDRYRNDSLTINVSIPIYQGGAEYSRVREAKMARLKSHDEAQDVNREVVERAELAWANYTSAQAVMAASDTSLTAASRALSGVEEEQKRGLRTLTEMLDEQTERFNAQVIKVQADKNVRIEAYRLLASSGKLTAQALKLPTDIYNPTRHLDDVRGLWVGVQPRAEDVVLPQPKQDAQKQKQEKAEEKAPVPATEVQLSPAEAQALRPFKDMGSTQTVQR